MKKIKQLNLNGKTIDFVLLNLGNKSEMDGYYDLFVACFGERSNINTETFKWFNLKPPLYENMSFAFIDSEKSKIIAAYGLLPGDVTIKGQIRKFAIATNAMTHPDYTGQGLFQLIGKESLGFAKSVGISLAFGVPNPQSIKGHLKVGWNIVNELNYYEWKSSNNVNLGFSEKVKLNEIDTIQDVDYASINIDKYDFFFNRSAQWMQWRLNKPFSDFLKLTISEPGELTFVVLKKHLDVKNNVRKLHIVDFGYENKDSFIELVKYSQAYAQKEGFDLVNLWQYDFNVEEVKILENLGFYKTESVNPIIIHKLGNQIELPESNWHITLFDNDVY
jgi:GNAT superfamily N-acetyltransferase